MVTDTKELLQRSDIRTMKKDLKRLKENKFFSARSGSVSGGKKPLENEIIAQPIIPEKIASILNQKPDIEIIDSPISPEKIASILNQKNEEVKKELQPQSNLKPLIEPKPVLLTSKPNIEDKIVIPSTNNIIKPQHVSIIAKENPVPQQQGEVIEMSNVAITLPHKEDEYLDPIRGQRDYEEPQKIQTSNGIKKIQLTTIEKPQTIIKTEEGQRKKFMEDVENWAASNKN